MRVAQILFIALSIASIQAGAARAESDSSWWCPFGCCHANPDKPGASVTQVSNTSSAAKKPAVLTKVSASTKRLVNGTKNMLSFKKPTAPVKRSGVIATHSSRPKQEAPGFFQKLFHPEPPPPPKTIEEWMSLKQVHP